MRYPLRHRATWRAAASDGLRVLEWAAGGGRGRGLRELGGAWQERAVWTSEASMEEEACAKRVNEVGVRAHKGGGNSATEYEPTSEYGARWRFGKCF